MKKFGFIAFVILAPILALGLAPSRNSNKVTIGGTSSKGFSIGGGSELDVIQCGKITVASGNDLTTATAVANILTTDIVVTQAVHTAEGGLSWGTITSNGVLRIDVLRTNPSNPTAALVVNYIVLGKR